MCTHYLRYLKNGVYFILLNDCSLVRRCKISCDRKVGHSLGLFVFAAAADGAHPGFIFVHLIGNRLCSLKQQKVRRRCALVIVVNHRCGSRIITGPCHHAAIPFTTTHQHTLYAQTAVRDRGRGGGGVFAAFVVVQRIYRPGISVGSNRKRERERASMRWLYV